MNAHQRRKWMTHKHYTMPLGSEVMVHGRRAKVSKHDSQRPHACIVDWLEGEPDSSGRMHAWVSIASVRPVARLRVRPWYRVRNERARLARGKA